MDKSDWRYSKTGLSFEESYSKEHKLYNNPTAFYKAADGAWQGYWFYDFYYWFIWRPISLVLDKFHSTSRWVKRRHQRATKLVADQDIWCWREIILDYFYNGFIEFVRQSWGIPLDINEDYFSPENRDLHQHIELYTIAVDKYRFIRDKVWEVSAGWDEQQELYSQQTYWENKAWEELIYILKTHRNRLWT